MSSFFRKGKKMKQMLRYLIMCSVLLIFMSQHLCAWQTTKGTTLFLADGKIAHLVPRSVVRKTMDVTLSYADNSATMNSVDTHEQYRYVVQVGTFAVKENAFRLERNLKNEDYAVKVWQYVSKGKNIYYVVTVGDYVSADEARQKLNSINLAYNVEGVVLAQGRTKE